MKTAIVAPDKFRGTASATEVANAMAEALSSAGFDVKVFPMSDGGEGLLKVCSGFEKSAFVTSADGKKITAGYKIDGETAVIEMAKAAGLEMLGGAERNDPMAATTRGVGELIKAAIFAGAKRVIVGCGGSATTDGGLGAIEALEPIVRLKGVELIAAVDVDILFHQAAKEFAAQKGASPSQVALLTLRLEALEQQYMTRFGVDVTEVKGGGAAGGLAGGLVAIGAQIVSGFDVVAEANGLYESLEGADLIVTGEGYLDAQSYNGKVVGRICEIADGHSIPYLVVVGDFDQDVVSRRPDKGRIFSLVDQVGEKMAFSSTLKSVGVAMTRALETIGTTDV